MAVGTLNTAKELRPVAYKPLLLAIFTFQNGDVLRCSTDALDTMYTGGFPYQGPSDTSPQTYLPIILNQDIAVAAALSDSGIDRPPNVSITLADPSKIQWISWEDQAGRGFKGAELQLVLIFWNVGNNDFSSNQLIIFDGVCSSASGDDKTTTIPAESKLNMSRLFLPAEQIQRRCFHNFPQPGTSPADSLATLQAAADDPDSPNYGCGYSYGATGSNARGNPDPSTGLAFTDCGYVSTDCQARGMWDTDHTGAITRRFSGIQWSPQVRWYSRVYGGAKEEGLNNINEAKYGDFIPLVYGEGWVNVNSMATFGDANSTRAESPICSGQIDYIYNVVVNDVDLPAATDITGASQIPVTDSLFRYNVITQGGRTGRRNGDIPWNGQGDCYGSIACIEWCVPSQLVGSGSLPTVRVLLSGPQIPVFTSQTASTLQGRPAVTTSTNPTAISGAGNQNLVWILLDILKRAQWTYAEMNMATFIAAAALCDQAIQYVDLNGNTSYHPRFTASLVIRQRTSAQQLVRGLRNAGRLMLYSYNGQLNIAVKGTLADQQPSPVPGSNYSTPVASIHATAGAWTEVGGVWTAAVPDGSSGTGYVAYSFDESNTVRNSDGSSSLRITQKQLGEQPNSQGFSFQDSDNTYANDSLTLLDSYDLARVGQQVDAGWPVTGIQNFDQGKRALVVAFSEINRGNPADDTRGTRMAQWTAGPWALHLQPGNLVFYSSILWNFTLQLFRIVSAKPSANYQTVELTASWHEDEWYTDGWGQHPDPPRSGTVNQDLLRPPYGWEPFFVAAPAGDQMDSSTEYTFGIAQSYTGTSGQNLTTTLAISGYLPVNTFASDVTPPFVRQGTSASTGGAIPGGVNVYARIVAIDVDGGYSAVSVLVVIPVPSGTNTNVVEIPNITWDPNTASWACYASTDPNFLSFQAGGTGTTSAITISSLNVRGQAMPDSEFYKLRFKTKLIVNGGVWGAQIYALTSTTFTMFPPTTGGFTTNQFAGYDVSLYGQQNSSANIPLVSFRIASNSFNTLTLASGSPDPTALGINPGDVLVMRMLPTVGADSTGNYVEDLNFQNWLCPPYGPTFSITAVTSGGPGAIILTTNAPHGFVVGDIVTVQGVTGPGAQLTNGQWTLSLGDVPSTTTFAINVPGTILAWSGGGSVQRLARGLEASIAGQILRCIDGPGAGYGYSIASNTGTRTYINGNWIVTPTSASRFIVETPNWLAIQDSSPYTVTNPLQLTTFDVNFQNFNPASVRVEVAALDANGQESVSTQNPSREIFVWGQASAIGLNTTN